MTPATRWHSLCLFYLAEECHFYLAPTTRKIDNKDYVKLALSEVRIAALNLAVTDHRICRLVADAGRDAR
jgi:diphthamide synthase subunit DPH2